ncbi:MAG TPA: hypothetical protein VLT47_10995 [Anaeromyxobacteraceae bacterium]|nr:hypothetical protein [Anaeromyxobacteraceae bacterium]
MSPADRLLAAARSLVDLDLPALAARLCPTGIRGVSPDDVPAAVERLSTCEMAAATIIRAAWGLAAPLPYVEGSAAAVLEDLTNALTWAPSHPLFEDVHGTALRKPTLDAPPTVGCGLWFAAAPGHPEHVDAVIVDLELDPPPVAWGTPELEPVDPPRITYSAVAGGQPPAPGMPGSWAVRLVARTLRWDERWDEQRGAWVDEGTGRPVLCCIEPELLAKMYGDGS